MITINKETAAERIKRENDAWAAEHLKRLYNRYVEDLSFILIEGIGSNQLHREMSELIGFFKGDIIAVGGKP